MSPQDELSFAGAQPCRPMRSRMVGEDCYGVRHSEMICVGRDPILVFPFVSKVPDLP